MEPIWQLFECRWEVSLGCWGCAMMDWGMRECGVVWSEETGIEPHSLMQQAHKYGRGQPVAQWSRHVIYLSNSGCDNTQKPRGCGWPCDITQQNWHAAILRHHQAPFTPLSVVSTGNASPRFWPIHLPLTACSYRCCGIKGILKKMITSRVCFSETGWKGEINVT